MLCHHTVVFHQCQNKHGCFVLSKCSSCFTNTVKFPSSLAPHILTITSPHHGTASAPSPASQLSVCPRAQRSWSCRSNLLPGGTLPVSFQPHPVALSSVQPQSTISVLLNIQLHLMRKHSTSQIHVLVHGLGFSSPSHVLLVADFRCMLSFTSLSFSVAPS